MADHPRAPSPLTPIPINYPSPVGWRVLGPKQDKFIGPSFLPKPVPPDTRLTTGATCLEEDTGKMFRWRATSWVAVQTDPVADLLLAVLEEIVAMREDLNHFMRGVLE